MLDQLVEERIQAAIARGDFDQLPGAGKPLELDDDRLVPEPLRMGIRILKNAGFVPPEVEMLRELGAIQARLLAAGEEDAETRRGRLRLRLLLARLDASGLGHTGRAAQRRYRDALLARLGAPSGATGAQG